MEIVNNTNEDNKLDFYKYWESLGFFDNLQAMLPTNFFILFEIARVIFSEEIEADAFDAIEEICKEEKIYKPDRDVSIQVNRLEKIAPISDKMEIATFKTINELRKALPRELAQDDEIFSVKLFTKTLIVQKFYESEADSFKPISTSRDHSGKEANRFEQKFYILLDRSKSMEVKMRTFYSKCIVAEFLRRKLNSKAKLYYRPFDSSVGKLYKIEKKEDFPILIENVLLTTTGGNSTNIEAAIYQAISDIRFDKEALKAEILIVTDGISKIDKNEIRVKLGDIKLNVLKIGDDVAEPDFYDMEAFLKRENINNFDPRTINVKDVKQQILKERSEEGSNLSLSHKRAYRFIFDYSEKMFKDLKDISKKFIEIKDLKPGILFKVDDNVINSIRSYIEQFKAIDISTVEIIEKKKLYKMVHFLTQYIQVLMENGNNENPNLKEFFDTLFGIKQKMLNDPDILFSFVQVKELGEDKKLMKLAKKEARRMMKQMQLESKKLSIKEMKEGLLLFTMDVGKGSIGQFIMLLFIKFIQFLKNLFTSQEKKSAQNE